MSPYFLGVLAHYTKSVHRYHIDYSPFFSRPAPGCFAARPAPHVASLPFAICVLAEGPCHDNGNRRAAPAAGGSSLY